MFLNRNEAGKMLALRLRKFKQQQGVVLAVPRGGVVLAYEVAKMLEWPLNIVLVKKIGHPQNKEYAIGVVGLTERVVVPHSDVSEEYIEQETIRIRERLIEMQQKYLGEREQESLKGKTVIVIDDGIATGNTLLGTIQIIRRENPAKIIVAVPVASKSAVVKIAQEVDELIVLEIPDNFYGVGGFYEDFKEVNDKEVAFYLDLLQKEMNEN